MDFHQRSVGRGNRAIFENLLEWFQMPRDFAECLWMSQLTQALCIQIAAEHLRRQQPRTEGQRVSRSLSMCKLDCPLECADISGFIPWSCVYA